MRNAIIEYLEPDIKSKKELWKSAVFVFDTNVLLNLYRYTQNTRNSLIDAISSFQDRIWMPHHVATEFMKNRCETIFKTVGNFESLEEEVDKFVKVCMNSMRAKDNDPEIVELKAYLTEWVKKHRNNNLLVENFSDDRILNQILDLYDGRVGKAFSEDEIKEILIDGENRYEDNVPPGFKDKGKSENEFGDLILWKEILRYSKENHKDIIFITHDGKEDWWNKYHGKIIGPHVKLRKEFIDNTLQKFGMYKMESFIKIYNDSKEEKLDQSIINEVNTIENFKIWISNNFVDKYKIDKGKKYTYELLKELSKEQLFNARKDIEICQNRIRNKMDTIISIEKKYKTKEMPQHVKEQLENTENNMHKLEVELLKLEDRYSKLLETI